MTPTVLQRYLDMARALQGDATPGDRRDPTVTPFKVGTPKLNLLRLAAVVQANGDGQLSGYATPAAPLPRALLVPTWRVVADEQAACRALAGTTVPLNQQVILEQDPKLPPRSLASSQPAGSSVTVTDISTDTLEVQASVDRPCVLRITDTYADRWTAEPIAAGPQSSYSVLPADVGMRGIPLLPGSHHIRLRYAPRSVTVGKWISTASLVAWIAAVVALRRRRRAIG
jgi:hypothetical protein